MWILLSLQMQLMLKFNKPNNQVNDHSRPQRLHSFWSALRITTSDQVQDTWTSRYSALVQTQV